jgi:acyl-homoserine-lactone acylase
MTPGAARPVSPFAFRLAPLAAAALLAACASPPMGSDARTATIQRTANGVPHITAGDPETLAYAMAYAYAQDNVCMTANQLVTVRGERSRYFGGATQGLLARRMLPNEQIDFFIAAHMDDAALERASSGGSAESQALSRGAVAGYNRYLADHAGKLPAACNAQPWVKPMTLAEFRRQGELTAVQAATAALADAMLVAKPPVPTAAASLSTSVNLADAADALRDAGLLDSPLGSNAWAFGKDTTANGSGLLVGNPHFPWAGVNRFWQVHLTIPGNLDVMGVGIGNFPNVTIGFNKDVAWSHTVSTGKRFTLHELTLAAGDPTSYVVDGQNVKMTSRTLSIQVPGADGTLQNKNHTVWSTRWGPVVVIPRAGLNWTAKTAYALKDANIGNVRATRRRAGLWPRPQCAGTARRHEEHWHTLGQHPGSRPPWQHAVCRCLGGARCGRRTAATLRTQQACGRAVARRRTGGAGWFEERLRLAQGSRLTHSGLIPMERMPIAVRTDWIHNSNDSFFYTNPMQKWSGISPMVGTAALTRPRTRAGLTEIPEMLARGKVTPDAAQAQLFSNRNFMASVVVPDLLAACADAPTAEARDGCAALRGWDRTNNLDSRGAHLFREFWRNVRMVPGLHRVAFDPTQPAATPAGLKMADAAVAGKVWDTLTAAVKAVRGAGFALDAPLGSVQRPLITDEPIALHGGEEIEGVLNNLGNQFAQGISAKGLTIDYGTSYVQSVTFDAKGPVARGLLTYGQSTDPASPHANDQLRLFSRKEWPALPFHADDVAKARVGEVMRLTRP